MATVEAKILEVVRAADAGLLVVAEDPNGTNKFVYRDATGIRWDEERGAFKAWEPERWEPAALLHAVVGAAKRELGVRLVIGTETKWHDDTAPLKSVLASS